jgi:DNA-directed RNA polymerase specialized sigma subunit
MAAELARKYTNGGGQEQFIELLGEGRVALCEAVSSYLEAKPACRFSTYAHRRVETRIVSNLRTEGTIRGSEWQARLHKQARASQDRLAQQLGRMPTQEELAYARGPQEAQALYVQPVVEYVDAQELDAELQQAGKPGKPGRKSAGLQGIDAERLMANGHGDKFSDLPKTTREVIRSLLSSGATVGQLADEWGQDRDQMMNELHVAYLAMTDQEDGEEEPAYR